MQIFARPQKTHEPRSRCTYLKSNNLFFTQKASILVLGTLSGSILGGMQSQKVGRKYSIMFDSVLFITATIIFILAKDLNMVLIARYIQGSVNSVVNLEGAELILKQIFFIIISYGNIILLI